MFEATILADSINICDNRLTTLKLVYPRPIHSELLTHRDFSRNSASSRAIPVKSMLTRIRSEPWVPIRWGKAAKGMVTGEDVEDNVALQADAIWLDAMEYAARASEDIQALGIHKTLPNRLTETWMFIAVIVTSTEWKNFWNLRVSKQAEDHFQHIATMMKTAYEASQPELVKPMRWHIPMLTGRERSLFDEMDCVAISTGRAARYSYYPRDDDEQDAAADMRLHNKLLADKHLSPFEHPAMALGSPARVGNFTGWLQYRKLVGEGI